MSEALDGIYRSSGEMCNSSLFMVPNAIYDAVYLGVNRAVARDRKEVALLAGSLTVIPGPKSLDPMNFVPGQKLLSGPRHREVAHISPHRTWHYHRLEAGW